MSKNPFVNCKSRKRRKKNVVVKQTPKGYCPRTMVRYDNTPRLGTVWTCKMCLACILTEDAARTHVTKCNALSLNQPAPAKSVEDMRYICEYCNRVFSRKVALKKHLESHEKSSSGLESDESDEEFIDPPIDTTVEPEV